MPLRHGLRLARPRRPAGVAGAGSARRPPPSVAAGPKKPHFPAKAKRVILLFMNGGPSHVDTFDPKPAAGQVRRQGACRRPDQPHRHGKLMPLAVHVPASTARAASRSASCSRTSPECIDDICVIRSMHADVPNHEPSLLLMNCGERQLDPAQPGLVGDLRPGHARTRTCPASSSCVPAASRFRSRRTGRPASCPASTRARTSTQHSHGLEKLHRHIGNRDAVTRPEQRQQLDLLPATQRATHLRQPHGRRSWRPASSRSSWPIRMQMEASRRVRRRAGSRQAHPRAVRPRRAGPANCLIARRLVERGVRFVQVWHGERPAVGQPRRHRGDHRHLARQCDQADRRPARRT